MEEVSCWCCEYFDWYNNTNYGICKIQGVEKHVYDNVCEDFLLLSGLFTKKRIPDYCKNKDAPLRKPVLIKDLLLTEEQNKKISFK